VIQREDVRKGLLIQLLSDYLNVPQGARATVDDIGFFSDQWWFTVRFIAYQPITPSWSGPLRKRPARYNTSSLRLWESDLELFEVVNETEITAAPSTAQQLRTPKLPALGGRMRGPGKNSSMYPNQLSLFLADDF
jgi:hypothetical protein